jgi:hypothetical protein
MRTLAAVAAAVSLLAHHPHGRPEHAPRHARHTHGHALHMPRRAPHARHHARHAQHRLHQDWNVRCAREVSCIERVARSACLAGDRAHCRLYQRLKARRLLAHELNASRCRQSRPVACVDYAAVQFGQPRAVAECVADAESTDDPTNSLNPTHHGLWQFDDETWAQSPYRSRSVWSAYWSSLAAMWFWEHGQASRWTTYAGCA